MDSTIGIDERFLISCGKASALLGGRTSALLLILVLSACRTSPDPRAPSALAEAPYPRSRLITGVSWDFTAAHPSRLALGSDLWPCAWGSDDNQYCAWGDGGGFDGNDDNVGRVSLGFARLSGTPGSDPGPAFAAKNVWGAPPYAETAATFGGKVVSLISVDGTLYAIGGFWTTRETAAPESRGGSGPYHSLAWSTDLGRSWQIAPWSTPTMLGTFLSFGRDDAGAIDSYVYIYYTRKDDPQHVFLKRIDRARLRVDPATPRAYEYRSMADGRAVWSGVESEAIPIFSDPNNIDSPEVVYDAALRRYLLVAGHYKSGRYADASPGQFGIFESRTPWGPWSTVAYYDDWGRFPSSAGDFLGVHMPNKWATDRGRSRWLVFSGLHELDSFNLARARFKVHRWLGWLQALAPER